MCAKSVIVAPQRSGAVHDTNHGLRIPPYQVAHIKADSYKQLQRGRPTEGGRKVGREGGRKAKKLEAIL